VPGDDDIDEMEVDLEVDSEQDGEHRATTSQAQRITKMGRSSEHVHLTERLVVSLVVATARCLPSHITLLLPDVTALDVAT